MGVDKSKIKEYLFSRSTLSCCIHFVWKWNENLRHPSEIHPHLVTKFTLVSDGWVLLSGYFKLLNFWSKSWNIYRMKDTALCTDDTTINLHFIKKRISWSFNQIKMVILRSAFSGAVAIWLLLPSCFEKN